MVESSKMKSLSKMKANVEAMLLDEA